MFNLISKYKEIMLYLFFGIATTLVNFIVYFFCRNFFSINYQISIIVAWLIAVLFAFYTNKYFVFQKNLQKSQLLEMLQFYSSRLVTLGIELFLMFVLIEKLFWQESITKILVQVLIIVINYILSKLFVFRKKSREAFK